MKFIVTVVALSVVLIVAILTAGGFLRLQALTSNGYVQVVAMLPGQGAKIVWTKQQPAPRIGQFPLIKE